MRLDLMIRGQSKVMRNLKKSILRAAKAISTVHKTKGLERERVVVLPCDKSHFRRPNTSDDFCILR